MELVYPINLAGIDDGSSHGDVLTRHGEYLGDWVIMTHDENEIGTLQFIADGESEPMFIENIESLDSGMLRGLAMSKICESIRNWHEKQNGGGDG